MAKFLVGRSDEILHLESGEGILFERYGETLRLLRDDAKVAFGAMYIYNLGGGSVTVTVASADVFYQVPSGVSKGITRQMGFQNARELVVQVAGTYMLAWNMSVEIAAANQEIEGTVMINGVANLTLAAHTEVTSANRPMTIGGTGMLSLKVGDLISMAVLNHTGATNITVDHITLSADRIGE